VTMGGETAKDRTMNQNEGRATGPAFADTGVKQILVIGSGAMGRQIGMAAAVAGFTTTVRDVAAAEQDMKFWLEGRVTKGRMDQAAADAAWDRITFTTDLEPADTTVDLVIEAATEKLDVKRTIFAELDRLAPAHAILATNSSTYGLQRPLIPPSPSLLHRLWVSGPGRGRSWLHPA
jgi:3-hydroxybutyryl-CoA dehydrogenase